MAKTENQKLMDAIGTIMALLLFMGIFYMLYLMYIDLKFKYHL